MPNKIPEDQHYLYDGYNPPEDQRRPSAQYLIDITPDEIKQMMEQKVGKPFAEIAKDMEDGKL